MGIFDFIKSAFKGSSTQAEDFSWIIEETFLEMKAKGGHHWSIKPSDYATLNTLTALSDKQKVAFIIQAPREIHDYHKNRSSISTDDKRWQYTYMWDAFMRHLLKSKLILEDADIEGIVNTFSNYNRWSSGITQWPVGSLINQVEKQLKQRPLSNSLRETLTKLRSQVDLLKNSGTEKEKAKLLEKIDTLLFVPGTDENVVKPTHFPAADDFGKFANERINTVSPEERNYWFQLMAHSQKGSGGKPSNKFLDEAKGLMKELGTEKFKKMVNEWMEFIIQSKEKEQDHTHEFQGRTYNYSTIEFIAPANMDMIKGFLWMCSHFHDKTTLFNLSALAERAYRKIPGKGPAAPSIGNAAIYALANSKGLDGVGHLSRLKVRIKQSNTQNLIDKYLNEAAASEGVTITEIEDMAVDDYGLVLGKKEYEFDGYKLELEIASVGKTNLNWFKPDGASQKSVPAAIKDKHSTKLKKIKDTAKQIELTLTAQRDRIDRLFKSDRKLSSENFNQYYFEHGLMSFLARKLIWNIEQNGKAETVIWNDGQWVNAQGQETITSISPDALISLWHPALASLEETRDWREFMLQNKFVQPLKQAYREVYLLTDAEINTRVYSNRMAAHILKQHQFNSLAKARGWKYSLLGAYDNGIMNQSASIRLPEYDLTAEFWINEVTADDAFNDTGIWLYVATDQVRFIDTRTSAVTELINIPRIVLSEVMRDVDLFVGVASVGNDPAWRDSGGLPAYRDYWQSYSFGDLTELAKTRKTILERLLPKLKIAKVAEIKDKFLVVNGKLRTYKIHLGSTNILMEPNDQYLCIVPDRSQATGTENIFLPFEGDNGLSIILSKAVLLADDEKITDKTITRQIKSR